MQDNEKRDQNKKMKTSCSAKFLTAKIAFEIPDKYQVEGAYDELVNRLMDLFDDCEYESENICNPPLLIVNTGEVSPAWIACAEKRINAVLQNGRTTKTRK